jgi:putative ABC transport system ATP-binding protein
MMMYATSDPGLVSGSIRENILLAIRRSTPNPEASDSDERRWTDLAVTGATEMDQLDQRIIDALNLVGMGNDLYRFGLHGRVEQAIDTDTASRLLEARRIVRAELDRQGLLEKIEPFDPGRYNGKATVGENLMFGVPLKPTWTDAEIGRNALFFRFLHQERLTGLLAELGAKLAGTMLEMVADLPQGHPLFERYSLIAHQELAEVRTHLTTMASSSATGAQRKAAESKFIGLALRYSEDRHRFALLDDDVRARIVAARQKLRATIARHDPTGVEFYEPEVLTLAAPVRENLLFGRMGFGLPQTEQQILTIIRETLDGLGLEPVICRLGLNYEVGPGGKLLSPTQRAAVNMARCLIKRTPIVVLDGALGAFSPDEEDALLTRLRDNMRGRTVIVTRPDGADVTSYDSVVAFKGTKAQISSRLAEAG